MVCVTDIFAGLIVEPFIVPPPEFSKRKQWGVGLIMGLKLTVD